MGEERHLLCPLHKLPGSNLVTGENATKTCSQAQPAPHRTCCDSMQLSPLGELNRFCTLLRVRGSGTNKPPESSTDCPFRLSSASLLGGLRSARVQPGPTAGTAQAQSPLSADRLEPSFPSAALSLPASCFKCLLKVKSACLEDFLITLLGNLDKAAEGKISKHQLKLVHFKQRRRLSRLDLLSVLEMRKPRRNSVKNCLLNNTDIILK